MIRTQISLSEQEYEAAKREAERLGISLAELLRRSLRNLVPPGDEPPWMRFAGIVSSGNPDSSQQIDDVVYGRKD
ncbi:MAG: CopG family transcriptional regulator [Chromatiales bacterium]|nr:CopG family transcriptional regulator [Chromatiales bacterium]